MNPLLFPLDQQILLSHATKKTREFLFAHPRFSLSKKEKTLFEKLVDRRKKHEPVAYILGKKEFFNREFFVSKDVLIPRPLTESLVELVIAESRKYKIDTIMDVGTGSGCIITTLAKELHEKKLRFFATDISKKALVIAKKNAQRFGVLNTIKFSKNDLLPQFKNFDNLILIANLPYISPQKYKTLSLDIRLYEPKEALIAKDAGLYYYKKLLREIRRGGSRTAPTILFFEIDPTQKIALKKYIKKIFPKGKIQFFERSHIIKISL